MQSLNSGFGNLQINPEGSSAAYLSFLFNIDINLYILWWKISKYICIRNISQFKHTVQFNGPTEEPVRFNQFSSCSRKGCSPNTILSIIPAEGANGQWVDTLTARTGVGAGHGSLNNGVNHSCPVIRRSDQLRGTKWINYSIWLILVL